MMRSLPVFAAYARIFDAGWPFWPLLLLALFRGPAWLIAALVAVACLAALVEFFGLLEARQRAIIRRLA